MVVRSVPKPLLWLLALNALGVLWFFVLMSPWQGFLQSDHAVPYLMVREPWQLQDFYFWRALRFGSVFVTFYKATLKPIFGTAPTSFYLIQTLFFFTGLALWLLSLSSWTARALFFWLLVPLTASQVHHFLMPGQLYGMVFFLMGFFVWLLGRPWPAPNLSPCLGVVSGVLFWQHELAGLLCAGVSLITLAGERATLKARLKLLPLVALGFIPLLAFAEVARGWAALWPVDRHYALEPRAAWWENIIDFLSRGIPFFGHGGHGHLLLAGLLVAGTAGIVRFFRERYDRAAAAFLPGALVCVLLITKSHHYTDNGRADRYFAFLVPMAFFFLVRLLERPRAGALSLPVTVLSLGIAATSGSRDPGNWITSTGEHEARKEFHAGLSGKADALLAAGCGSYAAPYWDAYVLTPISEGRLDTSASDHVRNPEIFDRVIQAPRFCASPALKKYFENGKLWEAACVDRETHLDCRRSAISAGTQGAGRPPFR